jgi:uncharacterized protein
MDPVVHFEIPVGDLAAAREFYQKSFGWEVQSFDMPGGGTYTTATSAPVGELSIPQKPGAINGALIDRNQPVGSGEGKLTSPIVTVLVESVEGAIKKVEDAGGKALTAKQTISEMGDYAYVADPDGNVLGLWHDHKWTY